MADLIDATPIKGAIRYIDARKFSPRLVGIRSSMHTNRSNRIFWPQVPDAEYYLQKSADGVSGWRFIASLTSTSPLQFLDEEANNTMFRHGYEYYRLVFPLTEEVSEASCVYGVADVYGAEIARRHAIHLSTGRAGNKCWAFIRMRDGVRCPDCWDEILQQRTLADCPRCYATGYLTGYYDPLPIYVSFGTEIAKLDVTIDGPKNQQNVIGAWTSGFPILSSSDIVIEGDSNAVWVVAQASVSTHKRVVTKQEVHLERSVGDDSVWGLIARIPKGVQS